MLGFVNILKMLVVDEIIKTRKDFLDTLYNSESGERRVQVHAQYC